LRDDFLQDGRSIQQQLTGCIGLDHLFGDCCNAWFGAESTPHYVERGAGIDEQGG
jgi:hypothetical protein